LHRIASNASHFDTSQQLCFTLITETQTLVHGGFGSFHFLHLDDSSMSSADVVAHASHTRRTRAERLNHHAATMRRRRNCRFFNGFLAPAAGPIRR
jgi:hypothetical protein